MITLSPNDSLSGVAGSASAVTCSIFGDTLSGNPASDSFGQLYQGQLPNIAATLIAAVFGQQVLIKSILFCNTTADTVSGVQLFTDGVLAANQLVNLTIPANGSASYTDSKGWTIYDSYGQAINGVSNITLTGDVTGSGSSTIAATVAQINGNPLGDTTPSAGNLLMGSGTDWDSTAISGDGTLASDGTLTVTKTNGVDLGSMATQNASSVAITGGDIVAALGSATTAITQSPGDTSTAVATDAFVMTAISALAGGMIYQGAWNASTNTPTLTSGTGTKGYFYKVSVAGDTDLDGITDWNVGDIAAFDGTAWDKIDGIASEVLSVFGQVGVVPDLSGDVSTSGSSIATLAASGVTAGSYGDGTHVAQVTVDSKGRVTSAIAVAITGAAPTGSASGDLSGSYPSPRVVALNGTNLAGLATGILKNTTATGVPSIAVAADFPTLNQSTTGTAANITGVAAVANGGTGSSAVPSGGQLLIGNAGGTAYAPVSMSGDASITATGAIAVTKTSGTAFGTMATQNANAVAITGGAATFTGLLTNYGTGEISSNLAYGCTLPNTTTGSANVALGYEALNLNQDGVHNVAIGYQSLYSNVGGNNNFGIGYSALFSCVSGVSNVAVGYSSGYDLTGSDNTLIGTDTGVYLVAASGNTIIGYEACFGSTLTTMSNCTFIGNMATASINSLSNATAIGFGATVSLSNQIVLGNSSVSEILGANSTLNLFDTVATTLNFGGAATSLSLGAATGNATINNALLALPNAATTTSAPAAGGGGALPATPAGYMTLSIGGTNRQIAYY